MNVLLVPTTSYGHEFFAGIAQIEDRELHFGVRVPSTPAPRRPEYVPVDADLDAVVPNMGALVHQAWLAAEGSTAAAERELTQSMSLALAAASSPAVGHPKGHARTRAAASSSALFETCHAVCRQLDDLGWTKIRAVDLAERRASVALRDAARRTHAITVEWDAGFPRSAPRVLVDAPAGTVPDVTWRSGETTLRGVLKGVRRALDRLDGFWREMECIDAALVVVEPERPSRGDTFRRVAAGRHCTLLLTLDPRRPTAACAIDFFGADSVVDAMHAACGAARSAWDPSASVVDNLDRALGTPLPRASAAAAEDGAAAVECGICYAYSLSTTGDPTAAVATPDVACNNPKCAKPFHTHCLREWLLSLPTARQSLGTVFGTCPYCGETVRVS